MDVTMLAHVGTGTAAVLLGGVALFSRKGGRVHVKAGRGFTLFMALSSVLGAVLGLLNPEAFLITFFAGVLAAYLIVSGWLAPRLGEGRAGIGVLVLGLINAANVAALGVLGTQALGTEDGTLYGFAGEDYLFLGGMGAIGLVGDGTLVFRKALSDRMRIARHLWRMGLGFFIAVGSAFTGPGASIFPAAVRQSGILSAPELIVIVMMLGYLIRVLFFRFGDVHR